MRTNSPKTTLSSDCAVEIPAYRPPLRKAIVSTMAAIFVEGGGVAVARVVVEIELEAGAGFGVLQFQFAGPRRRAVFLGPDLQQHQLVAEIGEILQGALAAVVVEKIGNHDHQAALRIGADELAHHRLIIRRAAGFEGHQAVRRRR